MQERIIEVIHEKFLLRKHLSGSSRPVVTRNGILVSVTAHRHANGDVEIEVRDYIRTYPEDRDV